MALVKQQTHLKKPTKLVFTKMESRADCFSANVQANGGERGSKQRPILGGYLHTYQPIR